MTRAIRIAACAVVAAIACSSGKSGDDTDAMNAIMGGAGGIGVAQGTGASPSIQTMGSGGQAAPGNTMSNGGTGAIKMPMAGGAGNNPSADAGGGNDDNCPTCTIPPNCQGFKLEGLHYSPGGTTLPNKCMPFHVTTNNPYAVRCIDAIPEFKTRFPGDQYCILPPPPDLGIQIGLHPQGNSKAYWDAIWAGDFSGYDNPDEIWVLHPGDEITQNYRTHDAPTTMPMNYYRTYFRMRIGSHHNIITMHDGTDPDAWIPGGDALPGLFDASSGAVIGVLGGQQRADDSTPVTLDKPPEDEGVYLTFPMNPAIIFNMHHFNIQAVDILREGWSNIWWETDATKQAVWYMGLEPTQIISLSVPANQKADYQYVWDISADTRLLRVFGHRHFWTTNFSTWIERASGEIELAYQSYDWADMPTYRYDSVVKNPELSPDAKTDGALSGVVNLKAGDKMHFNCHIEFTDERKSIDTHAPAPSQIGSLRFANEAYNGEMCIQFGNVVGPSLGLPGIDTSPLPDFAQVSR
jgi:hypothetical protein